jgi:predicted NUDIX family NTP pyrophosphohydrolase
MSDEKVQRNERPLSAGILLYRETPAGLRVLLAHPGSPFFSKKDAGAWSIPKGLVNPGEELMAAALREFQEETGVRVGGELSALGEVRLRSGKRVVAFALTCQAAEDEFLSEFNPGKFTMEWPPKSGKLAEFPEVDRIAFFPLDSAREKINERQVPLLDRLAELRRGQAAQS